MTTIICATIITLGFGGGLVVLNDKLYAKACSLFVSKK